MSVSECVSELAGVHAAAEAAEVVPAGPAPPHRPRPSQQPDTYIITLAGAGWLDEGGRAGSCRVRGGGGLEGSAARRPGLLTGLTTEITKRSFKAPCLKRPLLPPTKQLEHKQLHRAEVLTLGLDIHVIHLCYIFLRLHILLTDEI